MLPSAHARSQRTTKARACRSRSRWRPRRLDLNERLPVGIDVGVEHLATLSIGEHVANPRFGAAAAPVIRRAARKLSRARRHSKRRGGTCSGKDASSPTSASLTRRFRAIAVEEKRSLPHTGNGLIGNGCERDLVERKISGKPGVFGERKHLPQRWALLNAAGDEVGGSQRKFRRAPALR